MELITAANNTGKITQKSKALSATTRQVNNFPVLNCSHFCYFFFAKLHCFTEQQPKLNFCTAFRLQVVKS